MQKRVLCWRGFNDRIRDKSKEEFKDFLGGAPANVLAH